MGDDTMLPTANEREHPSRGSTQLTIRRIEASQFDNLLNLFVAFGVHATNVLALPPVRPS
jgi:hypothetical protein